MIVSARAAARLLSLAVAFVLIGASPAPLQTLRVGVLPNDDMVAVLYAQQTGMFKAAGLDVVLDKSSPNGAAIATAVSAGALDIGKSSINAMFDSYLHGIPFQIIGTAALYQSSKPYVGFFAPIDSNIKTAKDLGTGVTAVSSIHDLGMLAVYKAMDEAGLDPKTSHFVELPMSASAAAIDQKRVTAGEASYPPLQAALETGKYRFIPAYDEFGKEYIFSVWFVSKDFAQKHADVVKTFARVEAQAARYTNSHPKETVAMLSDFTKIPEATIQKMPRVTNGTGVWAAGIQPLIDTEAKYGFIAHAFPATEIIDPDIIAKGP